jgi:ribonucleotide monophosphatase NagD (HAD superfamily)
VTGRTPTTLGKPSIALGETLARRLGTVGGQTVVVGDATIEIALARAMGARSVLVLSGATSAADAARLAESHAPDLIVDDVGDLYRLIQSHLAYDRSPA